MNAPERKQEITDICFAKFMEKGLAHTSTRDLCKALNLNTGGIYWYFDTKDEVIIACAEEAALRIERDLIGVALDDIEQPAKLAHDLKERSIAMRPLMKFFVSVCASPEYEDAIQPALDRLGQRYKFYAEKFAQRLECETEEIAPYVYIVINTMLSYMLFGKKSFVAPQLKIVYNTLNKMLEIKKQKHAVLN